MIELPTLQIEVVDCLCMKAARNVKGQIPAAYDAGKMTESCNGSIWPYATTAVILLRSGTHGGQYLEVDNGEDQFDTYYLIQACLPLRTWPEPQIVLKSLYDKIERRSVQNYILEDRLLAVLPTLNAILEMVIRTWKIKLLLIISESSSCSYENYLEVQRLTHFHLLHILSPSDRDILFHYIPYIHRIAVNYSIRLNRFAYSLVVVAYIQRLLEDELQ